MEQMIQHLFDMTPLTLARSLLESEQYDYAYAMIDLPAEIGDFIIDWGRLNIPEDALFVEEDGGKGFERDSHVTVKYGLLTRECPDELRVICQETEPFPVWLGEIGLFTTNPKFDVVKINIESPWLRELNRRVSLLPNEDIHREGYQPHATIAYVQKGTCDHLEGENIFQESETVPEFIASGLVYKGPGEENDPERAEETLLFSRTRNKPVSEAVLSPDALDIAAIIQTIAEAARESNGDASVFQHLANGSLADSGVRFEKETHQMPGYADETGIVLALPSRFDLQDPRWPRSLYAVLHHEAVHLMQLDRMEDPKAVSDKASAYIMPGGKFSQDHYLQQKQEIMAHAASMVDGWRRQRLAPEEMRQRLQDGNWGFGMKYWSVRRSHPDVFKRFVRQAAAYIDLLRESALEVDPFKDCPFPVDSTRIRQFLQQRGQRQEPRPVL